MKKLNKIMLSVLSVALVVCMAFGLAGCFDGSDNSGDKDNANAVTAAQWDTAMSAKNYTVTIEDSSVVKYVEKDNGYVLSFEKLGTSGFKYYFEVKGDVVDKYSEYEQEWTKKP